MKRAYTLEALEQETDRLRMAADVLLLAGLLDDPVFQRHHLLKRLSLEGLLKVQEHLFREYLDFIL